MTDHELETAAAFFSRQPAFLGYQRARQRAREGWTEAEQARRLGCTVATLRHLALCLAVRGDEDAAGLAARFGCRAEGLLVVG